MHQEYGADTSALRFKSDEPQKKMAQREDDLSFLSDMSESGPQWARNLRKNAIDHDESSNMQESNTSPAPVEVEEDIWEGSRLAHFYRGIKRGQ